MSYKVAVLMGGQSFEREFSLESGKNVCKVLTEAGHDVLPLDTTSDLVDILQDSKVDVAYIALHGKHGEDGTIQSLLEFLGIPYVGCTAPVCRVARNKANLSFVISSHRAADQKGPASWPKEVCLGIDAFKKMGAAGALDMLEKHIPGFPMAVKPACGGSALGLHKVHNRSELANAILDALSYDNEVIIAQWISGVEVGVSVVEDSEGNYVALPPVEICTEHEYFDTSNRLTGDSVEYFVPPRMQSFNWREESIETIKEAALEVFKAYGCRDIARVDMIWDGFEPKVIELDVSPGMAESSLFPLACNAVELSLGEQLSMLLDNAVNRG